MKLRLLHLEDNGDDAELVRTALTRDGVDCDILAVDSGAAYLAALQHSHFDAVLSDSSVLGYDGNEALSAARERFPGIPFIVVSTAAGATEPREPSVEDSATARVPKSDLQRLAPAIRHALSRRTRAPATTTPRSRSGQGMQQLVTVVQRLSLARDLASIMEIVRHAARSLVNADGASFVLKDGDLCFYAEEDAVGPLWKGQRFPLETCISGWTMLNHQAAAIEDIYLDARIPHES